MSHWQALLEAPYVSLVTFRKSGAEVATPIWAAGAGNVMYAFSADNAGKVKRLRNNSAGKLAVCDVRGNLKGDWLAVSAQIIDQPAEINSALLALGRKYGWQMHITNFMSRLTGRYNKRAYLRISPATLQGGGDE